MLDFIPFVGSIKGAFEAFTGVDVITGKTLSASDRWAAGIGSVLGTLPIPGAKQGGKYLTKGTIELEEQLEKSLVSAGTSKYRIPMDLQLFAGKAGSGVGKVRAEDVIFSDKFSKGKFKNQVAERGWTNEKIADAINNPAKVGESINKATGNKVKLYFVNDVHYVAVDTGTGKVIQVADLNKNNWIPEGRTIKESFL